MNDAAKVIARALHVPTEDNAELNAARRAACNAAADHVIAALRDAGYASVPREMIAAAEQGDIRP